VGCHTEGVCIRRGGVCVQCNNIKFDIITRLTDKKCRVNKYEKLYRVLYLSSIDENQN
jgi:hypothetical protein